MKLMASLAPARAEIELETVAKADQYFKVLLFSAEVFKGWFLMSIKIILSLGLRSAKNFQSKRNNIKK